MQRSLDNVFQKASIPSESLTTIMKNFLLLFLFISIRSEWTESIEHPQPGSASALNDRDLILDDQTIKYDSSDNENFNQEPLLLIKSLRKIKTNTKIKNLYPPIVIENLPDNDLNDDLLDDLNKFGAYSKLISQLMNSIVNKELGLSTMQERLDNSKAEITKKNLTIILDDIIEKMIKKIEDAHSTIEITGERIEEIFHEHLGSNLTSGDVNYSGCCDFYDNHRFPSTSTNEMKISDLLRMHNLNGGESDAKLMNEMELKEQEIKNEHYHFEKRFNSWTNRQYSCDIDHHQESHFFNPSGANLTQQFQMNLVQNPNIKWQYFMSFLGVHTEYPAYLPPNNFCFLHNFISNFYANRSKLSSDDRSSPLINGSSVMKRLHKFKNNKKQDLFNHHRKSYLDLNQLLAQRHRENLFAAALPRNKLVVIVIDRGSALTEHQLNIAKSVAKYILSSLSHRDKVAIIDLTSTVHYPSSETCSSNFELAFANYETKHFYGKYIDDLDRSYNSTNHHLGFKKAFEIIAANYESFKSEIESEPDIFIPYVSRGLLASLADAKPVMKLISDELKNCSYSFVINTYALIDERIPIMLETIFLKEIAAMNFKKFNVELPPSNKIKPGLMVALNSTENLRYTLNGIYSVLTKTSSGSNLYVSLPHFDFISKDTHVSLSKAYHYHDRLIGVVGVDLSFFDLANDILNYDHPGSYAFLMDALSGKLLYHPVFLNYFHTEFRPSNSFRSFFNYDDFYQNSFINVEHIEQVDGFYPTIKRLIMTQSSGQYSIQLKNQTYSHWWNDQKPLLDQYSHIVYHWRRILSSPYIVVVASYQQRQDHQESILDGIHSAKHQSSLPQQQFKFVSHRLDYPTQRLIKLCKHFNQLATIGTSTIFLSPNAFLDPYDQQVNGDSYDKVRQYMAYLTDRTRAAKNPGILENVRDDVNIFNFLNNFWLSILDTSEISKYIVRKYIATSSGAFMEFPGSLLDQSFSPKTRSWYSRAVSNAGKMIFTPPYIDVGGSGYIVTISQAILDVKSNGTNDNTWAVMGIDLTLGYFHKIIDEMVPICAQKKTSCFLMDDYGYLIVHSSFSKPNLMPFIENQHITHKEPHMMNHLLNHKNFVQKLVCNSFTDRILQRYYMFNTSLAGIVTNIVKSENSSCAKYSVISLDGSNAFFGIVDHSCDNLTTFCPCSLTDRLCLNCHRMDETDCECPCECPLLMNLCSGRLVEREDRHPICIASSGRLKEPNVPKHLFESLNTCINNECFNKLSESECKGIVGCEWCSIENGISMKKPFCANQNVCFAGIYGSKNPYITNNVYLHAHERTFQNAPIGPLTTTLIICFMILTFSVYCFHFQANRNYGTGRYLNSNQNDHQILQPHNENFMDLHDNEYFNNSNNENNREAVASYLQALINTNQSRNLESPYQYNSNYSFNRRRAETESDYGYSTMTPNDDSEHNGPIYINPDIIRSNKKATKSKQPTTSSAASVVSNNEELSSSSSASFSMNESVSNASNKLPPPPSKIGTKSNRIRSKQKFDEYYKIKNGRNCLKQNNSTIMEESPSLPANEINLVQT